MLLIADDPAEFPLLSEPAPEWREGSLSTLPAPEAALGRALGLGERVWSAESKADFWRTVVHVREAERSQFDVLRELCSEGWSAPGPVACLAGRGSGFHGHRGRPWTALAGNLHLSVALFPADFPAEWGLAMTMLPAVATRDAVRAATEGRVEPGIKWVNDLLVEEKKLAGVLTVTQSQGDKMTAAILGVGLNVRARPEVPPTPFVPGTTALADLDGSVRPTSVPRALLDAVGQRYGELVRRGPYLLFGAYRQASLALGRRVRVYPEGLDESLPIEDWPGPIAEGVVTDLEPDLSLRIRGCPEPVSRGRLAFSKECSNGRGLAST